MNSSTTFHSYKITDAFKKAAKNLLVFFISLAAMINSSYADCTAENTFFNMSRISIPKNAPNGTVVAVGGVTIDYYCSAQPWGDKGYVISSQIIQVFRTEYPNVYEMIQWPHSYGGIHGFRFTNARTGEVLTIEKNQFGPIITTDKEINGKIAIKVEMIKLSDNIYTSKIPKNFFIQAVQFSYRPRWNAADPNGVVFLKALMRFNGEPIEIMPQTCTTTTKSIGLNLPPVAPSKLSTVGMTAGDSGFNIGLSCKSGSGVYITLTDLTDPGNIGDQLTLTPNSGARGVKLRILRNGNPVKYGPDSAAIGNTNQWYVGPSKSTSTIPLSAQYIATGPVSSGTVKGVATFTMSYQ